MTPRMVAARGAGSLIAVAIDKQRRFAMKTARQLLATLLLTGATFAAVPAMTGCYASEGAYVVDDTPPPPREEVVATRPGFVWIHGRWAHPGRRWVWQGGYYERERSNQVYVDGRWEQRGRGNVWVEGGWRARGGIVIR
jgi:hypothetical protein